LPREPPGKPGNRPTEPPPAARWIDFDFRRTFVTGVPVIGSRNEPLTGAQMAERAGLVKPLTARRSSSNYASNSDM
jgi:hypothetical protein